MTNTIDLQNIGAVVKHVIKVCCQSNDANPLNAVVSELSKIKNIDVQKFLFALVKNEDKKLGEFVIMGLINRNTAILASDDSLQSFCKKLNDAGLGSLAGIAMVKRINLLNKPSEMEHFIETALNMNFIGDEGLVKVFESVDSRISVSADNGSPLVELLQTKKPKGAKCKNSAHLFAFNVLSNNRKKQNLTEMFKDLKNQNFPSITDEKYINKLAECLIKENLKEEEQLLILDILFPAPKEYFSAYINKLVNAASKYQDKWTALLKYASNKRNKQIDDGIIQSLANSMKNEKSLAALGNLAEDNDSREYYNKAADKAWEIISSEKNKSGLGKLFGGR